MSPYAACLEVELKKRNFGNARLAELIERFNGKVEYNTLHGVADPEVAAMTAVLAEVRTATANKQRLRLDFMEKVAVNLERFDKFDRNTGVAGATNAKADFGRMLVPIIEYDPRAGGALSINTAYQAERGAMLAGMSDILDKMGKGVGGRQRGKALMDNVADEIFGQDTGDVVSRELAKAWRKTTDLIADMFTASGGVINKDSDFRLPQRVSAAKMVAAKEAKWIADHMQWLDWDKMTFPNGAPIPPSKRHDVLAASYKTLVMDGANNIEIGERLGKGLFGDMTDQDRFLRYKDGPSWRAAHEAYGDGNLMDVMNGYVDNMALKSATVRVLSANPDAMVETLKAAALKKASEESAQMVNATKASIKNDFEPMLEIVLRRNAMNPESLMANLAIGTSNILQAAQLGAAVMVAAPGDFATSMVMRAFHGMPVTGWIGEYSRALAADVIGTQRIAAQAGFVQDRVISGVYATERFSGVATMGPAVTRTVADIVMRASGMSGHTDSMRWAARSEFMGWLAREAGSDFSKVTPELRALMEGRGISATQWDSFRTAVAPYQVPGRNDVQFLRPVDIMATGLKDKDELFHAFQGMILDSSREMVPEATIEASNFLRGTTRPDSFRGVVLHSFAAYKNFPVSMPLIYGRLAMSNPERMGRIQFVAGLAAAMVVAGAVGTQLREISKGRDPRPMTDASFWGQALLSSGALSIMGDFLFYGVNKIGQGPADTVAGPIPAFVGDTAQLVFGDVFTWADHLGTLKANTDKMKFGARAVEYARRYTPGASIWYARTALERQFFDRLQEIADPNAYSKQRDKVRKQERDFGNSYWWAPGERTPGRTPELPRGRV